jgi:CheY-like chemotaxis protein
MRSGCRILVVDDSQDTAWSFATLLELDGNEVRMALDGGQALRTADEFRPQVVLLDIGLPDLDGYHVARCLRARPWGDDVILIAVTGRWQEDDRKRSTEAGFDRHVVKPVDLAALYEAIGELGAAGSLSSRSGSRPASSDPPA